MLKIVPTRKLKNLSREEEETSFPNESHMDLLSTSEEEYAMVAQHSPSSEDLDASIVTFGQQNSESWKVKMYGQKITGM